MESINISPTEHAFVYFFKFFFNVGHLKNLYQICRNIVLFYIFWLQAMWALLAP